MSDYLTPYILLFIFLIYNELNHSFTRNKKTGTITLINLSI